MFVSCFEVCQNEICDLLESEEKDVDIANVYAKNLAAATRLLQKAFKRRTVLLALCSPCLR